MNTDDFSKDLDMMQLSDSFFPTGLYATSNGLENIFVKNKNFSINDLIAFNSVHIRQQLGPCDCVIISNSCEYAKLSDYKKIKEMDSICIATKMIKEVREASFRSGIQLVKCVKEFLDDEILNLYYNDIQDGVVTGVYPVSFSLCCNALGIKKERALLMFLYGFVTSNVGAALRLGMIQHFDGQKIIHGLKPLIVQTVKENSCKSIKDMWQFSPQLEINQMSHEVMDAKMFIT